jgi:hypothetical protein
MLVGRPRKIAQYLPRLAKFCRIWYCYDSCVFFGHTTCYELAPALLNLRSLATYKEL